jgi:hypothetical protein
LADALARLKKTDTVRAKAVIDELTKSGLWQLSNDSLNNQTQKQPNGTVANLTLHDGTNYRFELIKGPYFLAVGSYAPEYFLEELPQARQREKFIKIRDRF